MLKLKDDIDLKELEKFGFKKRGIQHLECYYKKIPPYNWSIFIGIYDRVISVECDDKEYSFATKIDVIFDLIQAGLVEKIEE